MRTEAGSQACLSDATTAVFPAHEAAPSLPATLSFQPQSYKSVRARHELPPYLSLCSHPFGHLVRPSDVNNNSCFSSTSEFFFFFVKALSPPLKFSVFHSGNPLRLHLTSGLYLPCLYIFLPYLIALHPLVLFSKLRSHLLTF